MIWFAILAFALGFVAVMTLSAPTNKRTNPWDNFFATLFIGGLLAFGANTLWGAFVQPDTFVTIKTDKGVALQSVNGDMAYTWTVDGQFYSVKTSSKAVTLVPEGTDLISAQYEGKDKFWTVLSSWNTDEYRIPVSLITATSITK